ncbi:MAG: DUF1206 domain-containing protein [Flavisolibacter sp.]|nr:DUF1206 domain-containing protein [Flavisolibacter sp.]
MNKPEKATHIVHWLAKFGCIAIAIVYAMIGIVAILSFLKIKDGGADEGSILAFLADVPFGKVVIGIIFLGMLCFICWRIYETIKDPYNYGNDLHGLGKRTGIVLSALADALIAFAALQALLGNSSAQKDGQPQQEREMVADVLQWQAGELLIGGLGVVIIITAIVQFYYAISYSYKERFLIRHLSKTKQKLIHIVAWVGHFARGVILAIMGYFLLHASIANKPQDVVNTDKAFDFIGDHIGHVYFILIAAGTITYGVFMILQGLFYDFDKD